CRQYLPVREGCPLRTGPSASSRLSAQAQHMEPAETCWRPILPYTPLPGLILRRLGLEALAAEPEASNHGRRRWDWPRRCGAISIALTLPTLLAGCSGTQSVFDSAGPGAAAIQRI